MWRNTGFTAVQEDAVTIWMDYAGFADYWDPIAAGEGTLGRYVSALAAPLRDTLEAHIRDAYEGGEADGPRSFAATAFVCRGVRPP